MTAVGTRNLHHDFTLTYIGVAGVL